MSLRASELAQVVADLRARFGGAVVQKAHAPLPRLCYLELRVPGRAGLVCISAEPGLARISLVKARFPSPKEPFPFQKMLRQELAGARLTEIAHAPGELQVTLHFEREGRSRRLFAELTPQRGNIVLTGEDDRILAVLAEATRPRALRPGARYESPGPARPRREDEEVSGEPSRLAGGAAGEVASRERRPRDESSRLTPPYAESAEALLGPQDAARRAEEIRRRLLSPLRAQRARLGRTLEKVRTEAARQPEAEEHQRTGELLARNLGLVSRGASRVTLTEYTAEGPREKEIALDKALAPRDQAERHFRQYRRLMRGCEHARRRLAELEQEDRLAASEIAEIESRPAGEILTQVEVLHAPARRKGPPEAKPFREYLSSSGDLIWVGKSSAGNDALTFRVAKPHDVWLHARGVPGSHVVVPRRKGQALPQELLLDAAHLALHHSGAKGEPRGEVSYTQAKFVRRLKGAAPGQVTYTSERTFLLRVEPVRLARLLRKRLDASSHSVGVLD